MMKKYAIPMMVLGAIIMFIGESQTENKLYFLLSGIILLMVGIMQLSSKIPSKNHKNDEDDV